MPAPSANCFADDADGPSPNTAMPTGRHYLDLALIEISHRATVHLEGTAVSHPRREARTAAPQI